MPKRINTREKYCIACGGSFNRVRMPSGRLSDLSGRKFCCVTCANRYNQKDGSWNKGIPHTAAIKLKIGLGCKRRFARLDYINPVTRPEVRQKISITMARYLSDPRNNARYIDGRSGEKYPFEFNRQLKEQIRARDNYTCQDCGIAQYAYIRLLDIHHRDGDKHNLSLDNLVTLCLSCHMKEHGTIDAFNKRRSGDLQYAGT